VVVVSAFGDPLLDIVPQGVFNRYPPDPSRALLAMVVLFGALLAVGGMALNTLEWKKCAAIRERLRTVGTVCSWSVQWVWICRL